MSAQRSIVICGGAFAGLALALALRQGLGRRYSRDRGRSGAGDAAEPRSARHRDRRRLPPAVRGARRLGPGRADRAADPRHGRHQFQAGRRHPSGVSHLRRRRRAGRALRAYGREPPSDRCAGGARRGRGRRTARHRGERLSIRAPTASMSTLADGHASKRACWSPPTARARSCASGQGSPPMAGTTINPASSSPSAMSAIMTAAPKNIFCPRGRSRSCR